MSATAPADNRSAGLLIQPRGLDYREIAQRSLLVFLNLGSVAFLWWSLQARLLPLQQETRDLTTTVARLSGEVSLMEATWTPATAQEIRERFGEVRTRAFNGRGALETWLAALKQQVVPLALDIDLDLSKLDAAPATNSPAGPTPRRVLVEVRPAAEIEAIATPFQRILQLTQRLVCDEPRADLVDLSVAGGLGSVSRAVFVLDLWTSDEGDAP
jgi:hypothetical protein